MEQNDSFPVSGNGGNHPFSLKLPTGLHDYRELYVKSLDHRDEFWRLQAQLIQWDRDFTAVFREDFSTG